MWIKITDKHLTLCPECFQRLRLCPECFHLCLKIPETYDGEYLDDADELGVCQDCVETFVAFEEEYSVIVGVEDDGHTVELEDGSTWQIAFGDDTRRPW